MGQSAGAIRAGGAYVELHGNDDSLVATLKSDETTFAKWGTRISQIGAATGQKFAKGLSAITGATKRVAVAAGLSRPNPSEAQRKQGAAVTDSVATSGEKYSAKLKEYQSLLKSGAITQQTFNRAVADAKKQFDNGLTDSVATSQEKYAARLKENRELLKSGAISQQTFNRAMADAKREFDIESPIGKANKALSGFLSNVSTVAVRVGGLALGVVTAFIGAAKSFESNADRLSHLSKTGITPADLQSARQLRLAMSTVSTSIQAAWSQIGAAVAPVVTKVLNWTSQIVQGFTRWASANRPLIANIGLMAVRVAAWAAGIFVAVKGLMLVGGIIAFLAANPLVALAAALAAGIAAWLAFSSSGQAAFGGVRDYVAGVVSWLQEKFGDLYKDFQTAWAGIVAAVSKGDLSTAAEIVWLTLKLAFFETVKALGGNWNKFYESYIKTVALIGDAWDVLFTRITTGFDTAFTKMKQGWRGAQTFLAKGIAYILGVIEGKTAEERQQVWDTLDEMQTQETKKADTELAARNKAAEKKMMDSIEERRKNLEKELESLPANDEARIKELRGKLETLATEAKDNSPQKPQFYAPRNIATAGTFNAAAIRGVAGGTAIDQIAANTKETAKQAKATVVAINKQRSPSFGSGSGE